MKKYYFSVAVAGLLSLASIASAHVVVKPNQAGIGAFQTFTMSVPVEKDIPTIGLRLVIPEGLQSVTPTVKQGWKIAVKKEGTGEGAKITEIAWTGGSIPAGQRDDFSFSAQVPAAPATLVWKAYQTYQDGTVVAWAEDPAAIASGEEGNPFSVTHVVDDLSAANANAGSENAKSNSSTSFVFSIVALVFSIIAIVIARKNKEID